MVIDTINADAPVALAASIAAQAQTRELNALRTERDTLVNALRQIALTEACSNSDPEVMGKALDNCVAIAQGALRSCQQRVRCTAPPRRRQLAPRWTRNQSNKQR